MSHKLSLKTVSLDLAYDLMGCFLLSASVQCFSAANNMAPGGVSGVAILINHLFGLPISMITFAINVPLILLAWRYLGRNFTLRTVKTVLIYTVMLELCAHLPAHHGNIILTALFGGVIQGVGIGLVFMRGSTTGGADIASQLIRLKFPHIPVGQVLIGVDALVLGASAIVYRNIENAMAALLLVFVSGRVIDSLVYGLDTGKVMMIISERHQEIEHLVTERLQRGCTILEGHGSYTGESRPVLLVAVRRPQYVALKKMVWQVDSNAFLFVLEANEIFGKGFRDGAAQQ